MVGIQSYYFTEVKDESVNSST